jgi:hypothetical protein
MTIYDKCYWCGQPATGKEHVPPDNLFPPNYKVNLITVGSCKEHNNKFSELDENFRLILQTAGGNKIAREVFSDKTLRGFKRNKRHQDEFHKNTFCVGYDNKTIDLLKIDGRSFNLYFGKIVRALYFYHSERIFNGKIIISSPQISTLKEREKHFLNMMLPVITSDILKEGDCKNPSIFNYRYYLNETPDVFFAVLHFYDRAEVIGLASDINPKE